MADNQELCSCLDNKAQIKSTIDNKEQISSQITRSEQIKSNMTSVIGVSEKYTAGESDNIDLDINNTTKTITANVKQIQFDSAENFPTVGSEKLIYIDKSTNKTYIWTGEKYDSLAGGTEITVDSELSTTSENPVQNKVITGKIDDILDNNVQIAKDYEKSFGVEWNAGFLAGQSKSKGNWSIGIGCDSEAGQLGISIGNRAKSNKNSDVLIGTNAQRTDMDQLVGNSSVGIGLGTKVSGIQSTAIGALAKVEVDKSAKPTVQIAEGTNTNGGSLQFRDYQVVGNDGKIPNERLNIDTELSDESTNAVANSTVNTALSAKQDTLIAGANITIADDGRTISATGGGGTITLDSEMSDTSENGVQNKVIKSYVDSGLENKADLLEENTFAGKQTFNGEIGVNATTTHTKDISLENSVVKILDTANDAVTTYGSKEITIEQNGAVITHKLSLPDKSGTLITDSDFNTKHSKIQNADTETENVDEWRLLDTDSKIRLVSLVENDETEISLERNYTALKHAGTTGAGEISVSANNVVMESKDLDGNIQNLTMSPTKTTINNKEIITEAGGTFENRPKVKENGEAIDIATKSDLENYLEKQSDKDGVYSQITNQDGQVSVNISENGDTQTFIINKNGATLNGLSLFTSAGGTITGDVNIQGNVTVTGETTIEKTKDLAVENAIIYTNANKVDLKTILSGLAIYKDGTNIYGIMYDPASDSVKLGLGSVDAEGKFTFNTGEGKPVAVRADNSLFVDGHLIKWDSSTNSFVDSGKELSETASANSIAERTIGGALKATPIIDIDIENQTDDTVATKKDIVLKVDKVAGKQLSTNDFTDAYKTKLDGLSNYDDSEVKSSIETLQADKQDKLTAGTNISITNNTISAVDTKYTAGDGISISDDNVISTIGGSGPNVVQTTGTSETDVMSQKAVTDQLENKITKNLLDIYVGTNDACSDTDGNFGQCSQIYKTDGTSYTVRKFLFNKDDFQQEGTDDAKKYSLASDVLRTSSIEQTTGTNTDKVMSQDSVTKEFAKYVPAKTADEGVVKAYTLSGSKSDDVCTVSWSGDAGSIARYNWDGFLLSTVDPTADNHLARKGYNDKTYVKKTDIVDDLTTEDATKPLSANQGKVLDDKNSATNQQITLVKSRITELANELARKVEMGGSSGGYTTNINNNGNAIELIVSQGSTRVAEILINADGVSVNTTQAFKLNGGTIAYDSATDTFTV